MKTSAGLLSLALFLAVPAAAQRGGSSSGGHASSGSSSHGTSSGPNSSSTHGASSGSASRATSSSPGGYATHSSYVPSSSGYSAGAASRIYQASGKYIGSAPAPRPGPAMQRGFVRAPYVGSLSARVAAPLVRAAAQTRIVPRGPFITSVPRLQPGQNLFFGFGRHFHHGFGNSFCGSSLGFGFGGFNNSFGCLGGFGFSPFLSTFGEGYGTGLYYANGNYGYSSGEQVVDASSYYEPASAPGSYMPYALTPAEPEQTAATKPVTLLELIDGTMYGVADYWLDHGQLHYVASYGGENAVPIERVDLHKTVELNSANGLGFVLRNAPAAHPAPAPPLLPLQPLAYPDLMF